MVSILLISNIFLPDVMLSNKFYTIYAEKIAELSVRMPPKFELVSMKGCL